MTQDIAIQRFTASGNPKDAGTARRKPATVLGNVHEATVLPPTNSQYELLVGAARFIAWCEATLEAGQTLPMAVEDELRILGTAFGPLARGKGANA